MALTSILQVFKLNEVRKGTTKDGRAWEIHEAECAILSDSGSVEQVGVLNIPRDLQGKVAPGIYIGSFALRADTGREGGRRIQAVLTGLQPYATKRAAS